MNVLGQYGVLSKHPTQLALQAIQIPLMDPEAARCVADVEDSV